MSKGYFIIISVLVFINALALCEETVKVRSYVVDIPQTDEDKMFLNFIAQYNKNYASTSDFEFRREIFKRNLVLIQQANASAVNFVLDVNQFADRAPAEIQQLMRYTPTTKSQLISQSNQVMEVSDAPIVKKANADQMIDWRSFGGVMSQVKDQVNCGASWAYAAVSAVEAAHFVAKNESLQLSVQQVIDCYVSDGCLSQQSLVDALTYAKTNALESVTDFPDKNATSKKCAYNSALGKVTVSDITYIESNNTIAMKEALAKQPILAVVQVGVEFVFYKSGTLDVENTFFKMPHPLLIVGHSNGLDGEYWIAKNSWGESWGESGYIRIAVRPNGGVLGIQETTFYPTTN